MEEDGVSPCDHHTQKFNRLIDFYIKKEKKKALTKDDLLTYSQAFLCQPAVEMGSKNDPEAWKYIFFKPSSLPSYRMDF